MFKFIFKVCVIFVVLYVLQAYFNYNLLDRIFLTTKKVAVHLIVHRKEYSRDVHSFVGGFSQYTNSSAKDLKRSIDSASSISNKE